MRKLFGVIIVLLLLAACGKDKGISPLPPSPAVPTLSYPFASFASVVKFIPFGDSLHGNPYTKGYQIKLSNSNQSMVSACSGRVNSISSNDQGSNDVVVIYKKDSPYTMLYSGIGTVTVAVGDSVVPGSILGSINSTGIIYFELRRNNLTLCPSNYAASAFNTDIELAIKKNNYFNPDDSIFSPCLLDSI